MTKQISKQLKKLQSEVKSNKQLPMAVVEIQRQVQRFNYFVKNLLNKENEMVLPKEIQANVLQGSVEVNRLCSQLSQTFRSANHFRMYRKQFLQERKKIQDRIFCLHLTIENGFYELEPRGFRLSESIQLSWKRVQDIYGRITQRTQGKYLSSILKHNPELKEQIRELYQVLSPLSAFVLKIQKKEELSDFFTLEELKITNRFFKEIQKFHQTIEAQHLDPAAFKKIWSQLHIETVDHISKELHFLKQNIQRYSPQTNPQRFKGPIRFEEITLKDLYARITTIHIQTAAILILRKKKHVIQTMLAQPSALEASKELSKMIGSEKQQQEFFIKRFSHICQNLMAVNAILSNLSVSFGKICQLSLKSNLTPEFLIRTFQTAHNLLTKSIQFAEVRQTDSEELKLAIEKTTLFHRSVEKMILSAFEDLENAHQEIINYDKKLMQKLTQINQQEPLLPAKIQTTLKATYENRRELSTAAIYFDNICYNFEFLVKELKTIDSVFQQFNLELIEEEKAKHALQTVVRLLDETSHTSLEWLQTLWTSIQCLHWYFEEILLANLLENQRYQKELKTFLAPVKKRIEQKQLKRKQKTLVKQPQEQRPNPIPSATVPHSIEKKPKVIKPLSNEEIQRKSANTYNPFLPRTTEDLKKACRSIGTEAILSVLEVLERPHAFFNFLDRLEQEYDPESPFTEALWMAELKQSQSAMDFVLGFAKVKFLPYGYVDPDGIALPYDVDQKKIQRPPNKAIYLKISSQYVETPLGIFKRLMLIMLGYEDAGLLGMRENEDIIRILNMDFVIPSKDQRALHLMLPFLS